VKRDQLERIASAVPKFREHWESFLKNSFGENGGRSTMRRLYRRYKAPNCEKSSERNTEANGLLMEGTNRRLASLVYTSVTRATEDHGPATGPIDRMRISA